MQCPNPLSILLLFGFLLLSRGSVQAQEWSVEQPNLATILLDIDCPDKATCYAGGAQDGIGPQIFVTRNGGKHYDLASMDPETTQMTFMSTASGSGNSAVTGGMGFGSSTQFTTDGTRFSNSDPWSGISVTQSIEAIHGIRGGYGFVGQFDGPDGAQASGLAKSVDGGKTWETIPVEMGARPRYGSFPSPTHYVLSGGSWPPRDTLVNKEGLMEFSEGILLEKDDGPGNRNRAVLLQDHLENAAQGRRNGYKASIAVSTDGGRTFRETYFDDQQGLYFNQISCPDTTSCWVTAEGGGSASILASSDGGYNWNTVWSASGGYQLMGIEFQNHREGWACGTKVQDMQFMGLFLHTVDGGQTWQEKTVPGQFCTSLSFAEPKFGHATALNQAGSSSTLVYQ